MTSKRLRLIYNPYAGRCKFTNQLDAVIRIFQESGHEVCVHRACSTQDIEETAGRSSDVDCLVIAGGDGSIHQAVNGLAQISSSQRPSLGILPVGTANDLAYALHLPKSIPEACKVIGRGNVFNMDIGMVNNRYFVNVACAGLLTDVSLKVDLRVKNSLGQLAYFLKGIETLPSYRPFKVEFEHEGQHCTEEVILFMAVNGLSVGGIRSLVPRASLSDGKLDILMVPLVGWPETLRILLRVLRGEQVSSPKMKEFQVSELTIHTDRPLNSDLDGELGPGSPWHIHIGPKISVFC
ncbi:conserved protein of unknown function BmrU [Desulfosporosinus acidiphilus SJ4]|uniref:DAGKc domain-containing protein n=1 Tax=Desulfosporosinus acidiphilus (strain DSM 22704 / JCM 16185 / SJ4) TaxID=646529 RepID=I4D4L2_DESAJ|nr:diacylglycerol kinase family protein [Desulfosporosinus acidiphilus]AFM40736.1 conserved protein of unknown function BmrU [Desulfosporosinus acidiphilus SJ4]